MAGTSPAMTWRGREKLHFEDFQPGTVAEYGPRLVTREEIIAFAAEFDPQPMHLDEAAGRATMLGGLARLRLARVLPDDAHDAPTVSSAIPSSMGAPRHR